MSTTPLSSLPQPLDFEEPIQPVLLPSTISPRSSLKSLVAPDTTTSAVASPASEEEKAKPKHVMMASMAPKIIYTENVLPRAKLGCVSYQARGSNICVSANIVNVRKQLQRRDTGEMFYSVAEFMRSVNEQFGVEALNALARKATTTTASNNTHAIPRIKALSPHVVLKCGSKLEHSDVWL